MHGTTPLNIVIMAGGLGKRMKSDLPKVLHPVNKIPILVHVIRVALSLANLGSDSRSKDHTKASYNDENLQRIFIIVGKYAPIIQQTLNEYLMPNELRYIDYVYQMEPMGTGHAVQQVLPFLAGYPEDSKVLVLSGDVPLITKETLLGLLATYDYYDDAEAVLITTDLDNPTGNGRIIRDNQGLFRGIVEEKDCTEQEKRIKEVNAGIYLFNCGSLLSELPYISNNNAQHEYYLPDVLPLIMSNGARAKASGLKVSGRGRVVSFILDKSNQYELLNINDQEGLREAQRVLDVRAGKLSEDKS